jgi:lysophospholipase L1-like esterase
MHVNASSSYLCVFAGLLLFALTINAAKVYAYTSNEYKILGNSKINIIGRYTSEPDNSLKMSYPGVTTGFTVYAKRAAIVVQSNTGNGRIDVLIDDVFSHTLYISAQQTKYPLFFSDAQVRHQIKLINRTESWQSINQLFNLEVVDGELLPSPPLPQRKLLVIGDSVTCGSAVSRGAQCDTHINGHDARNSYGYKLAEKLDANVHLVCFGGRGIIRSWDENPEDIQAPAFFEKALPFDNIDAPWDHKQYTPDAIIVSLGTNDFNPGVPNEVEFVSAYVDFVKHLNVTHPSSHIFVTEGAMLNNGNPERQNKTIVRQYLTNVITKAGLKNLSFEPAQHYPGDNCDAHPTATQHEKMAQDLERTLRAHLNW